MVIEQTIEIPADYRLLLELPRSVPTGVKAHVEINIPAEIPKGENDFVPPITAEIEDIRQLLQKEMAEKGTLTISAANGDGWEAHVKERYAES